MSAFFELDRRVSWNWYAGDLHHRHRTEPSGAASPRAAQSTRVGKEMLDQLATMLPSVVRVIGVIDAGQGARMQAKQTLGYGHSSPQRLLYDEHTLRPSV